MRRILFALFLVAPVGACSQRAPAHELVHPENESVRISGSRIADGKVHFYTFEHKGKNVNFLVRTDGKGTAHAHLDACFACYRYKRGFVVEDSNLVCIACRLEYEISDEVWDYIGACAPIPVHSSIDGDDLIIKTSILARASRYF